MVGGFATHLHGFARFTADIDIWIKDEPQNRKNPRKALTEIDLGDLEGIETMQLIPNWSSITLHSGIEPDIMTYLKGLDQGKFDECYELSPVASIENVKVRSLQINQLIAAKKA